MIYLTLKALSTGDSMMVYGWLLEHIGKGSFSKTLHEFDTDTNWAWHASSNKPNRSTNVLNDYMDLNPTVLIFKNPTDATYFALSWGGICGEPLDRTVEHLL